MQQEAQVSATVIKEPWNNIISLLEFLKDGDGNYIFLLCASIVVVLVLVFFILRTRHANK